MYPGELADELCLALTRNGVWLSVSGMAEAGKKQFVETEIQGTKGVQVARMSQSGISGD